MPIELFQNPELSVHIVSDGTFALDGGAMFGVVPKTLWQRTNPADEQNRIKLGTNCLLIQTKASNESWQLESKAPAHIRYKIEQSQNINILINTGTGSNFSEKLNGRYAIDHEPDLLGELKQLDLRPEDIDIVILTHLHFDHCGGNTKIMEGEKYEPAFSNAVYIVQQKEWAVAIDPPNSRLRASYLPQNILPIANQVLLVDGDTQIIANIRVQLTQGHSDGHQIVLIKLPRPTEVDGSHKAKDIIYLSDLIPTGSHLPIPYCMAYDLYPLQTMEFKEKILTHARQNSSLLVFEHDHDKPYQVYT